jgi:hypothetical protein
VIDNFAVLGDLDHRVVEIAVVLIELDFCVHVVKITADEAVTSDDVMTELKHAVG